MGIHRPSQRLLNSKLEQLSMRRQYRDRLLILQQGRGTAFWSSLKKHLEIISSGALNKIENVLGDPASTPEQFSTIKQFYGARQVSESMIEEVENTEKFIERATEEIKNLEAEISEIEKHKEDGVFA